MQGLGKTQLMLFSINKWGIAKFRYADVIWIKHPFKFCISCLKKYNHLFFKSKLIEAIREIFLSIEGLP
jgi:hypothetical protein